MEAAEDLTESPSSDYADEAELLRRAVKGNEVAFLALYRRHQGPVFRFALHMSGSRDIAEEVTQEVFLAMLTGAHQYAPERGSLEAFLIGIARNQVRRHIRALNTLAAPAREPAEPPSEDWLEALNREQDLIGLRAAVLALPPSYREVVVLCDFEGIAYAEAAQQIGCAVGTVRSRLHRARAILQRKLTGKQAGRYEKCPV